MGFVLRGVDELADAVTARRRALSQAKATIVAISGIDASGKGTLAAALAGLLRQRGLEAEIVGADTWLTPLDRLQLATDPAGEFYRHGIRFDGMFQQLAALQGERHTLDVILAEGIFLFKRELRQRYDLSIWIDCGFETALRRALARNQEGLSEDRLIEDYRRIYFPAQEMHFLRDFPVEFAECVHCSESQNS